MGNKPAREPAGKRAPVRKRPAPAKRARTKASVANAAAGVEATVITATTVMTDDERYRLIAETAYYLAEKRGFREGRELEDWLEAEAIISARLQDKRA
jgi:hypothetical protein